MKYKYVLAFCFLITTQSCFSNIWDDFVGKKYLCPVTSRTYENENAVDVNVSVQCFLSLSGLWRMEEICDSVKIDIAQLNSKQNKAIVSGSVLLAFAAWCNNWFGSSKQAEDATSPTQDISKVQDPANTIQSDDSDDNVIIDDLQTDTSVDQTKEQAEQTEQAEQIAPQDNQEIQNIVQKTTGTVQKRNPIVTILKNSALLLPVIIAGRLVQVWGHQKDELSQVLLFNIETISKLVHRYALLVIRYKKDAENSKNELKKYKETR